MPTVVVQLADGEQRIPYVPGPSLRHILDATDHRVRAGCRGTGACGLCRVRIEAGEPGEPTLNERILLGEAQLARGVRLACQIVPQHDLRIVVLAPAPKSAWRRLDGGGRRHPAATAATDCPPGVGSPCGVAIDLGTTQISLSLHGLADGHWLAGCRGVNPQIAVGADVMTRLVAACESPEQAQALQQQTIEAIGEALGETAVRGGISPRQVVRLVLVANTAMLALLTGRGFAKLLQPRHWGEAIDCRPTTADDWTTMWGIHPQAEIQTIPPLAGFVGSDLLAGVLATDLVASGRGSLLVDFGTNSEIALWDGRNLWATSAAGGPAFEGSGIRHGLPAGPGAIQRVSVSAHAVEFEVIDGGEPQGICGSGLVDLIAGLARLGKLNARGQFAGEVPEEGFAVARGPASIVLGKRDVDVFQRAKAAVAVGIQVLLDKAGMTVSELRRLCVSGALGTALDIGHAQAIGLLPGVDPSRVEVCGNTALAGCEEALFSAAAVGQLQRLADQAVVINLAQYPAFDDLFLEHLYLRAWQG